MNAFVASVCLAGSILWGTQGCKTWLFLVILGWVPGYQIWLFWLYSGRYPGTKPGCFDHTRVGTRVPNLFFCHTRRGTWVPNLVVLVIIGEVPGYQTWLFWSYSGRYPGTKPGCFGHTRVGTLMANLFVFGHTRVGTRVPTRI